MITWIMGFFVSVSGLIIAYSTFQNNKRKDVSEDKEERAKLSTQLDFISNDIKDIKADNRTNDKRINEIDRKAEHALERAEAAHNRLDRAHIDIKD